MSIFEYIAPPPPIPTKNKLDTFYISNENLSGHLHPVPM